MSISINSNSNLYNLGLSGYSSNQGNTNQVGAASNSSGSFLNSINQTFADLGINVDSAKTAEINPGELAINDSINQFMNDLFSAINKKDEQPSLLDSTIGQASENNNADLSQTTDLSSIGTAAYSDTASQIQDLISQLNQDNSASIMASQLKENFNKINNSSDATIQDFLQSLAKNLNGENLKNTGNNLDIFAA